MICCVFSETFSFVHSFAFIFHDTGNCHGDYILLCANFLTMYARVHILPIFVEIEPETILSHRLWNGSFYATGLLSVLSVCPVCNVGVLWLNGYMDKDATWYGCSPGPGHMRHRAKLRDDRSNRCWDMVIFLFSKMAAAVILDIYFFLNFNGRNGQYSLTASPCQIS